MPDGPGKYDVMCTTVREATQAEAAVVIVVNGNKGSGFSVQVEEGLQLQLAEMLEAVAAEIRKMNQQIEPTPDRRH